MGERLFEELSRSLAKPVSRRRALGLLVTRENVHDDAGARVDALARALAAPMTRSGALRALGGAVAAAATFAAWRPRGTGAGTLRVAGHDCPPGSQPCGVVCCHPSTICFPDARLVPGSPIRGTCCRRGTYFCPGHGCCRHNQTCPKEPARFGGTCGAPKKCPGGKPCGNRCCKKGEACCGGKFCCSRGTFCCGPPTRKLCCKSKGGSCCPAGSPHAPKYTCCPPGEPCARMILPGNAGITDDSPRVCCPKERVVPLSGTEICCPQGQVSMGGALIVPPGGGGGLCCREDKACGAGASLTCCSSGNPTGPELEQICCNGVCVSFKLDPQNCGGCGIRCAPGQFCGNGQCVTPS